MTPEQWIVNASPLILLGKVDQLELLGSLAKQIIPRAVVTEIGAKSDGKAILQRIEEHRIGNAPSGKTIHQQRSRPGVGTCVEPRKDVQREKQGEIRDA